MRLLICTSEYYPSGSGIANVVYNVIEHLKRQGIECTVCSPTGPDITLGSAKLIETVGFVGLAYYWYQVSHFFKDTDYDAVWLQNPYFIRRNPFPRCLATMHSTYYGLTLNHVGNTPFLGIYYKIISMVERYCLGKLGKTTIFTGVGHSVCEELVQIGIPQEYISNIPNGVDITKFHPSENKKELRRKFEIPNDDIILLSVGRLTSIKQPHLMLKVFSVLEKQLDTVTLCIAGKGELLDSTQKLAKIMGIHKIKFLGHVDNQETLPSLYACSDYYIMTSKYEGSPSTLIEAMASGLPCIVSDIPSLAIVKEINCGIMVNFNNIDSAGEKILNYLREKHSDQGDNANMIAEKKFGWDVLTERYLDEFKGILNS